MVWYGGGGGGVNDQPSASKEVAFIFITIYVNLFSTAGTTRAIVILSITRLLI